MPEIRSGGERVAAQEVSARILTFRYVVALAILAMIAVASHVSFTRVLRENGGSTFLNVVSGQQQTLVQLIARYASQYAAGDVSAHNRLVREIDHLSADHDALIAHMDAAKLPEAVIAALRSVYLGETSLKARIDTYVDTARRVAAAQPGSAEIHQDLALVLADADGAVYQGLRRIVDIYNAYTIEQLRRLERMQNSMLAMVFLTLAMEAGIIFNPMVRRIVHYTTDLLQLASTDPLTGLLNRRSFLDSAFAEVRRARRDGAPSALMSIDADHFKRINDTQGHQAGDEVLMAMATALAARSRNSDVLGRIGGEEFAILMPGVSLERAMQMAERLRGDVARLRTPTESGFVSFTISIGVTLVRDDESELTPALNRADKALYAAKSAGRNKVAEFTGADEPIALSEGAA
ncbi:GGDEF domain-containing protein [Emcibacter sp. SYSU 3D8]|uniref:GGDEF domain-containing protein n=1 Tax=Emcibacter sp. SYSU 3D8 TaxID=3133969 RepID=UPI0031FF3A64